MKYREAKDLDEGTELVKKSDNEVLILQTKELYGQHKIVRFNCLNSNNVSVSVFHNEVELK